MTNGRQRADENLETFSTWAASKTEDDFVQIVSRGALNRREIATECGFARSVLNQNPRVRQALAILEDHLREKGVLPQRVADAGNGPTKTSNRAFQLDAERLRRLEQENALLRAENHELKAQICRFAVLSEVLAETGRLPR